MESRLYRLGANFAYNIIVIEGITIDRFTVSPDCDKVWFEFEDPEDPYNCLQVCLQDVKLDSNWVTVIKLLNVTELYSTFSMNNIVDMVYQITRSW